MSERLAYKPQDETVCATGLREKVKQTTLVASGTVLFLGEMTILFDSQLLKKRRGRKRTGKHTRKGVKNNQKAAKAKEAEKRTQDSTQQTTEEKNLTKGKLWKEHGRLSKQLLQQPGNPVLQEKITDIETQLRNTD